MQKIVINAEHGGFSLCPRGEREYLARKGKVPYFYRQTKYEHRDGVTEYARIDNAQEDGGGLFCFTLLKDLGPTINAFPEGDDVWFNDRDIERTDPDLVALIEEKGSDFMSGRCAQLKVVEIPDGVAWRIEEYDGLEWVAEEHRTWR